MQAGTQLGPYEILEPLGKGGMGEVWLAEDTRLRRKVAIKVLPDEFARDPERLARFEQEARAAAALNHPHIAAVFDVGRQGDQHYIVQEYLEGRSLRELLQANPLGLGRALTIASEAASGLAAAHRAGIVHRDVKPENLFLTVDEHTKVLDFGLAKLGTPGDFAAPEDAGDSPTQIGTLSGVIMGSVGYMAPEQVESGEVDERTDVFALGCVLYEMLAGRRPFHGANPHATLSAILSEEPAPLTGLRSGVPLRVVWILNKCLAKEPARRYQHMEDLAVDLKAAAELEATGGLERRNISDSLPRAKILGTSAAILTGLALFLAGWLLNGSTSPPTPTELPMRTTIVLPESAPVVSPYSFGSLSIAVSPDGNSIVYAGDTPDGPTLFRRDLGDDSVTRLPGTEGASLPIISPDGNGVAFYTDRQLWRVHTGGDEPAVPLTETRNHVSGAAWLSADRVLYTDFDSPSPRLFSFGDEQILPVPDWRTGLIGFAFPTSVLDNELVLGMTAGAGPHVAFIGPLQGPPTELLSRIRWMVASDEAVAFVRDRSLYAARWASMSPPALGTPRVIAEGIAIDPEWPGAPIAVGGPTLAWIEGPAVEVSVSLSLVDRNGDETLLGSEWRPETISFSPDGERILYAAHDLPDDHHVWIHDPRDGSRVRVAAGTYSDWPVWGPDGRSVFAFHVDAERTVGLVRFFEGDTPPEYLLESPESVPFPGSLHPDGATLLYRRNSERTGADLMLLELGGAADPTPFLDSNASETDPRFSPGGDYVAYVVSDEPGSSEVYVRAFPAGQPVWKISDGGGTSPRWSADGSRLFFQRGNTAWAVPIRAGDALSISPAVQIFETDGELQDISPDGNRFLVTRTSVVDQPSRTIEILVNWTSLLER